MTNPIRDLTPHARMQVLATAVNSRDRLTRAVVRRQNELSTIQAELDDLRHILSTIDFSIDVLHHAIKADEKGQPTK